MCHRRIVVGGDGIVAFITPVYSEVVRTSRDEWQCNLIVVTGAGVIRFPRRDEISARCGKSPFCIISCISTIIRTFNCRCIGIIGIFYTQERYGFRASCIDIPLHTIGRRS